MLKSSTVFNHTKLHKIILVIIAHFNIARMILLVNPIIALISYVYLFLII